MAYVKLKEHTSANYPELWSTVYIHGGRHDERAFLDLFVRAKCRKADTPDDADFVVFTGGGDVSPTFYDEESITNVHSDYARDSQDFRMFEYCLERGIPMIGVCRGMQLLHVAMGGKLHQDIDNHRQAHSIYDYRKKMNLPHTPSVHHQSIIAPTDDGMFLALAGCKLSTRRVFGPNAISQGRTCDDVEAMVYPEACILGVQGHPEYTKFPVYSRWFLTLIQDYLIDKQYVHLEKQQYRRNPEHDLVCQHRLDRFRENILPKLNQPLVVTMPNAH